MTIIFIVGFCMIAYIVLHSRRKNTEHHEEYTYKAHINGSFKCESCGATVRINEDDKAIFCPFCGARLPEADKLRREVVNSIEADKQRNFEREKILVQDKSDKRRFISNMTDNIKDTIEYSLLFAMAGAVLYGIYWLISITRH